MRLIPDSALAEFNHCHSPQDGTFARTGTGTCQRGPGRGPGSAGKQTLVGITSARPGKDETAISHQMAEFATSLKALPGVSHVRVTMGRGAWKGGGEASWIVAYRGNGEARRLLAKTGKRYNQDAVLVLSGCKSAARCSPMVEWAFDSRMTSKRREFIDGALTAAGFGGWTWLKKGRQTVLRLVSVPQWGGERQSHLAMTQRITRSFNQAGLRFTKTIKNVRPEVMAKDGTGVTYDEVLRRAW